MSYGWILVVPHGIDNEYLVIFLGWGGQVEFIRPGTLLSAGQDIRSLCGVVGMNPVRWFNPVHLHLERSESGTGQGHKLTHKILSLGHAGQVHLLHSP